MEQERRRYRRINASLSNDLSEALQRATKEERDRTHNYVSEARIVRSALSHYFSCTNTNQQPQEASSQPEGWQLKLEALRMLHSLLGALLKEIDAEKRGTGKLPPAEQEISN